MSDDQRERVVRAALRGVGDELLEMDPGRSGHVLVHFQNTIPVKVEWRILARPMTREEHDRDD